MLVIEVVNAYTAFLFQYDWHYDVNNSPIHLESPQIRSEILVDTHIDRLMSLCMFGFQVLSAREKKVQTDDCTKLTEHFLMVLPKLLVKVFTHYIHCIFLWNISITVQQSPMLCQWFVPFDDAIFLGSFQVAVTSLPPWWRFLSTSSPSVLRLKAHRFASQLTQFYTNNRKRWHSSIIYNHFICQKQLLVQHLWLLPQGCTGQDFNVKMEKGWASQLLLILHSLFAQFAGGC